MEGKLIYEKPELIILFGDPSVSVGQCGLGNTDAICQLGDSATTDCMAGGVASGGTCFGDGASASTCFMFGFTA